MRDAKAIEPRLLISSCLMVASTPAAGPARLRRQDPCRGAEAIAWVKNVSRMLKYKI